jgi:hypothetical protein
MLDATCALKEVEEEEKKKKKKKNRCIFSSNGRRDFPLRHRSIAQLIMSIGHMSKANEGYYTM